MPRRLVTISYTGLDAGGGVPKFNRDLHAAFPDRECRHFCWDDAGLSSAPVNVMHEWEKAFLLNRILIRSKRIGPEDVVVADGFWADGLHGFPFAVSHSHGIWSHLTHDDVLAGKTPDMPLHHAAQVSFRRRWQNLGKHMTAVSAFIAEQMRLQWGFTVDRVINNGVDTDLYRPRGHRSIFLRRPLVIHGVNDRSNLNKGWDHIEALVDLDADIMSLDEAYRKFQVYSDMPWTKPKVLAQADLVVHPSGFEGNSLFVAESLSCGIPVVGYDVGYLWSVRDEHPGVLRRSERDPERTAYAAHVFVEVLKQFGSIDAPARELALRDLSITSFRENWRSYVEEIENA